MPGLAATCPECRRVFDLTDPTDAVEFYDGHDCEEPAPWLQPVTLN